MVNVMLQVLGGDVAGSQLINCLLAWSDLSMAGVLILSWVFRFDDPG